MDAKPLILCVMSQAEKDGVMRQYINTAYAEAVKQAGGILVSLSPVSSKEDIDFVLEKVQGILLPGGSDVNPALYGEETKEYAGKPDTIRDILDIDILDRALERKMPIFAICRGFQMLNVQMGGTLYQDVKKEMPSSLMHDQHDKPRSTLSHEIIFAGKSLLREIIDKDRITVNSLHHQGIKKLGDGLTAIAHAPDGLIEAVEYKGYPFLIAVQWHPEELILDPLWQQVFARFIDEAKRSLK